MLWPTETRHNYMVIQAKRTFIGLRFGVAAGDCKVIRWLAETPRIVAQARSSSPIEWAGSSVNPADYTILHDGAGLPEQFNHA